MAVEDKNRLETGYIVCTRKDGTSDHRAVVIRGDTAIYWAGMLRALFNVLPGSHYKNELEKLVQLLESANHVTNPQAEEQKAHLD